jgi:hypothetical protein
MRVETLLSPGLLANGIHLRREAAKAISSAEIISGRTPGGKAPSAAVLQAFFTDCASKLSTLVDTAVPTVTVRAATSATQITITLSEAMDISVLPSKTTFAVTGAGTPAVTSIAYVDATHLRVTGTGFAAGNTVAYTAPATNFLRDKAQNKLASFSGVTA